MTDISDEEIAAAVQSGDLEAFGELMNRYETKLKRYAYKFLNTKAEIDDLVQDVFVNTYTNIQSFDTKQRFSPWIYRIAHNMFVNELQRKGRGGIRVFDADTILPFLSAKETADSAALEQELSEEMQGLVYELPIKYREVIILHYFESQTYQEISSILQISVTSVGARMTRARAKLRALYEPNETQHE